MRDRTNKQLAEKLDIIKESFNENGSVFELLTIVQERLISIPIEPPVILPSREEIKEHVIKSFGTDGSLRFGQMPDDDQERVRMNAEYFRYGAEWAVSKARSK